MLITRTLLDLAAPLVVRKAFWCNGRLYQPSDAFNWRKKAVSERVVRQLWEDWKIDVEGSPTSPTVSVSAPEKVTDGLDATADPPTPAPVASTRAPGKRR